MPSPFCGIFSFGEKIPPKGKGIKLKTRLYFDGSFTNTDGYSCTYIVDGLIYTAKHTQLPSAENVMEAEYEGLILGLTKAVELGVSELEIVGDAKVLLDQLSGKSRVRKTNKHHKEALNLLGLIPSYTVRWVPSDANLADGVGWR